MKLLLQTIYEKMINHTTEYILFNIHYYHIISYLKRLNQLCKVFEVTLLDHSKISLIIKLFTFVYVHYLLNDL